MGWSSSRSPYRIQCSSSSNRFPYRIQCNSSSNMSPYRIQCNSKSPIPTILPLTFSTMWLMWTISHPNISLLCTGRSAITSFITLTCSKPLEYPRDNSIMLWYAHYTLKTLSVHTSIEHSSYTYYAHNNYIHYLKIHKLACDCQPI